MTTRRLLALSCLVAVTCSASATERRSASSSKYDELLVKNRARRYDGQPSPNGVLYVYADDSDIRSATASSDAVTRIASPTVDGQNLRAVNVAVVSQVSHTIQPSRLGRDTGEVEIGTVTLAGRATQLRPPEVNAALNLRPVRILEPLGARRPRSAN